MIGETGEHRYVRSADGQIDCDEFIDIGAISRVEASGSRRIENVEIEGITTPKEFIAVEIV